MQNSAAQLPTESEPKKILSVFANWERNDLPRFIEVGQMEMSGGRILYPVHSLDGRISNEPFWRRE